jgi:hypothetical protein
MRAQEQNLPRITGQVPRWTFVQLDFQQTGAQEE